MRGLSDEERMHLEDATRPEPREHWADDSDVPDAVWSLERRGLITWEPLPQEDEYTVETKSTPLGDLALRADAAARAKGVWP